MSSRAPKLVFVLFFALNCILWSQSRYAHIPRYASSPSISRRNLKEGGSLSGLLYVNGADYVDTKEDCHPVTFPVKDQCTNVLESCPQPHTVLSQPYLRRYFCADPKFRPAIFAGYLVWLLFLFSTLGISASDFFCPNLGTLSNILGLDENVAGVTFLAFGNGSPDVFATFSAMRSNSGGLAIGELLGAATFITSCVVGSMCIIKPFKVDRGPFLRDVGFFTIAIIVLLVVLWDSELEAWESIGLVAMYFTYVSVVVFGSWWEKRQNRRKRHEAMMRDEFREENASDVPFINEPYHDDPTPVPVTDLYIRGRAVSTPGPPRPGLHLELPPRPHTRSSSPHSSHLFPRANTPPSPHGSHMPSFSLVGALEFRRVVTSLQHEAAGTALGLFDTPITPYPGGHYHQHSHSSHYRTQSSGSRGRTPALSTLDLVDRDPWDAALAQAVPLEHRSPRISFSGDVENAGELLSRHSLEDVVNSPLVPVISHTPASPSATISTELSTSPSSAAYVPPTKPQRIVRILSTIWHVLFPTLHNFRSKSFLGMIAALFAAPAVLMLTLTLPVVMTDHDSNCSHEEKLVGDGYRGGYESSSVGNVGRLVEFEEEGVGRERTLVAEEDEDEDEESAVHELKFNKWLMAVQCTLGPLFCVSILFDGTRHEPWLLLAAGVAGATFGVLVAVFATKGEHPTTRFARCTMGFAVAIVWVMAIADEVVEVLQTFGLIFGLSDAIIGLTIFAMGNSLADLVANMSVAVFAPIMGFSACFGGPMLNILLGVGISGTYVIRQTGKPYPLEFSTTLVITSTGLLTLLISTLIFVPWNGYFLPRKWGFALIVAYVVLMTANIVAEVLSNSS